jgi:hypothetical protein
MPAMESEPGLYQGTGNPRRDLLKYQRDERTALVNVKEQVAYELGHRRESRMT